MSGWDSYRAVYGAELRAAARELDDHGWQVVVGSATTLRLKTGAALDVLEVPAALGRGLCARLRAAGALVPVAATPTGTWWFPITTGDAMPAALGDVAGAALRTGGAEVLAPPSEVPDGWVHWRVAPALSGYRIPESGLILGVAAELAVWSTRAERTDVVIAMA